MKMVQWRHRWSRLKPISHRNMSSAHHVTNQLIPVENDHRLVQLFDQFSSSEISYSFGYGSGVFQQAGYTDTSSMQIDVVHVVDDPVAFHSVNTRLHPEHYSGLLRLGVPAIAAVQKYGAGVYFNPYVRMRDRQGNESMVKYGVVSTETAMTDICEWSTLYIAGRLQKPVKHLYGDDTLRQANDRNLDSAFRLSLMLMCPPSKSRTVSPSQIYEKIASLSYMGDPRMAIGGENPNKVKNIVSKQLDKFSVLYEPYMERALERKDVVRTGGSFGIRMDRNSVAAALVALPIQFRNRLLHSYKRKYATDLQNDASASRVLLGGSGPLEIGLFLHKIASDNGLPRALATTVLSTIAYPALVQTVKGIFSAGVVKSTRYAWEKKLKSWS